MTTILVTMTTPRYRDIGSMEASDRESVDTGIISYSQVDAGDSDKFTVDENTAEIGDCYLEFKSSSCIIRDDSLKFEVFTGT